MVIRLEKINYWRVLRRVIVLAISLILLVACSAQVHAENEPFPTEDGNVVPASAETQGLTEENFSAVAVQLEAVARSEGRSIADRMMHTALSAAAVQAENAVTPAAVQTGNLSVIVVPEKNPVFTPEKIIIFSCVILIAAVMAAVVCAHSRKSRRTVYKPMLAGRAQTNFYANYGTVRTYR